MDTQAATIAKFKPYESQGLVASIKRMKWELQFMPSHISDAKVRLDTIEEIKAELERRGFNWVSALAELEKDMWRR